MDLTKKHVPSFSHHTLFTLKLTLFFLEIPDGTKKCCSACLTRLTRKITQLTGSSENHKSRSEERLEQVLLWREEEIETLKSCLRNSGKNWSVMSETLNKSKSPDQCKKFFYSQRKKHQLDKLVLEYKRVRIILYMYITLFLDDIIPFPLYKNYVIFLKLKAG